MGEFATHGRLTLGSVIPSVNCRNDFPMPDSKRLPISTRHAFALAFDLAVRRDPLHSLVIPVLMRAPWTLTLAFVPSIDSATIQPLTLLVASAALMGDFVTLLVIGAMLRIRARSVFNTPARVPPALASDCYARGLGRIPSLLATELVRNAMLAIAASLSILPTVFMRLDPARFMEDLSTNFLLLVVAGSLLIPTLFVGFRLGVATESVVLDGHGMASAFQRSFRMMQGRFERWLEIVSASAALVLGSAMLSGLVAAVVPSLSGSGEVVVFWLLIIAMTPVIQYAWTFFYLRLAEIEEPFIEAGPAYALGSGPVWTPGGARVPRTTEEVPAPVAPQPDPEAAMKGNGVTHT